MIDNNEVIARTTLIKGCGNGAESSGKKGVKRKNGYSAAGYRADGSGRSDILSGGKRGLAGGLCGSGVSENL